MQVKELSKGLAVECLWGNAACRHGNRSPKLTANPLIRPQSVTTWYALSFYRGKWFLRSFYVTRPRQENLYSAVKKLIGFLRYSPAYKRTGTTIKLQFREKYSSSHILLRALRFRLTRAPFKLSAQWTSDIKSKQGGWHVNYISKHTCGCLW